MRHLVMRLLVVRWAAIDDSDSGGGCSGSGDRRILLRRRTPRIFVVCDATEASLDVFRGILADESMSGGWGSTEDASYGTMVTEDAFRTDAICINVLPVLTNKRLRSTALTRRDAVRYAARTGSVQGHLEGQIEGTSVIKM